MQDTVHKTLLNTFHKHGCLQFYCQWNSSLITFRGFIYTSRKFCSQNQQADLYSVKGKQQHLPRCDYNPNKWGVQKHTHTQVYACFAFLYNLFTCILNILQYYSRRASQLDSIAGLGIEVYQLFSTQRGHRYSDNETNKREVRWISLMGILPHWSLGHSSTQAFCTEKRWSCRTAEGKLEHWASTRSWTTLPELVQSGVNWRISSALNSRGDEWLPADVKTQPPPGAQAQRAGTQ